MEAASPLASSLARPHRAEGPVSRLLVSVPPEARLDANADLAVRVVREVSAGRPPHARIGVLPDHDPDEDRYGRRKD
jgi:hypothetical protein